MSRVAVVTGAARGIGAAICRRLQSDGMTVVLADVDEAAGLETMAQLAPHGEVHFVSTDVSDEASVVALMDFVREEVGRLDVLVNNAARARADNGPLEKLERRLWDDILAINLTGPYSCARHAAPMLRQQPGSCIVNVASIRAIMSEPETEAYTASKGGLVALTHALAMSVGPAVRMNCISPGWIHTTGEPLREIDHKQHPAGREGRPEDVAALVSFLVGPEAGFLTAANFVVDGGITRRMVYVE